MELKQKLHLLADAAKYDASCSSSGSRRGRVAGGMGNTEGMGICHSYTPDRRCVSLLKLLLTNFCIFDCQYCVNRISSDTPRARFQPSEVVYLTMEFYRRNFIEGLFLSSGIIQNSDYTMEQMIEVARSLREDHKFGGYIHLKVVPEASRLLIEKAGRYADRVSANIEMARQEDLANLAPAKNQQVIVSAMREIRNKLFEAKEEKTKFAPAGQTTQMIVGATPTSDAQILNTSQALYQKVKLRRVYYSAFSPIPHADPRLPIKPPPLVRENRLYQADWLIRFYGFKAEELTSRDQPNLSLHQDPKTSWALRNRDFFPVDINQASRQALMRVPGLGVRNVERIQQARRHRRLTLDDLIRLKVNMKKARYFIVTRDYNPDVFALDRLVIKELETQRFEQLSLFEAPTLALTGEL